jgi:hypothetical protein
MIESLYWQGFTIVYAYSSTPPAWPPLVVREEEQERERERERKEAIPNGSVVTNPLRRPLPLLLLVQCGCSPLLIASPQQTLH